MVITIARQTGCGASHIGERTANTLGFRLIDRQLLAMTAESLGCPEEEVAERDERLSSRWERFISVFSGFSAGTPDASTYTPEPTPTLSDEELFRKQSEVMHRITQTENAVIIGRAGGWLLRDVPDHLAVLLHAPLDWRVKRLCTLGVAPNEKEAREALTRSDEARRKFVTHLAAREWDSATHYHVCLDVALLGLDMASNMIVECARKMQANRS